jgi:hypothetical protein
MTSLADFLMRNKLDALGDKPEYTTADVNSLMPQQPSWQSPLASLGSYQLSQEAGAEPNWFGRNVLSNIPPEAMHAANFLIPGKVPRLPNPIKAYHGSPHDFDKFDLSKIGTGEGAQAYGHGLYFAENEGVARSYRDALAPKMNSLTDDIHRIRVGGEPIKGRFDIDQMQEFADLAKAGDVQGFRSLAGARADRWKRLASDPSYQFPQYARDKLDTYGALLKELDRGAPIELPHGRMYEVALHATPEQFLDWDKPLSGQSEASRRALSGVGTASKIVPAQVQFGKGFQLENSMGGLSKVYPSRAAAQAALDNMSVGMSHMNQYRPDPQAAAGALREAGIPGIRYLDQGSRGAGTGTSNYVVWSPELIEILRKYAAPPAIAAPALASILQDQQSQ